MLILGEAGGGVYRKFPYCLCNYSDFTAVSGRVSSHTQVGLTLKSVFSLCCWSRNLIEAKEKGELGRTKPRIAGGEQVEREKVSTSQHFQGSERDFSLRVDPYSRHIRWSYPQVIGSPESSRWTDVDG